MRIKPAAVVASLIVMLGATALLAGGAVAHTGPGHSTRAHHGRGHRRTVQPVPPPASAPRHGGGVIQNPVWGHQGKLRTLRPSSSAAGEATAASCDVAQCGSDPDDPIQSGCWDANASIVNSAPFPVEGPPMGYVANWWSPDCGTNWAETVLTNDPGFDSEFLDALITDQVTGERYEYTSYENGTYTDMTHSATTTACAAGALDVPIDRPPLSYGTYLPGACA